MLHIRQLTPGDVPSFVGMLRLFEAVFGMDDFRLPPEDHLEKLLRREGFVAYAAFHDNFVVGGLTAHVLASYYSTSPEVYIYDLGVSPTYQRKGIGKQLLAAILKYGKQHHCSEVFVQADEPDTHALDFYRSTGGCPEKVVHFTYPVQ